MQLDPSFLQITLGAALRGLLLCLMEELKAKDRSLVVVAQDPGVPSTEEEGEEWEWEGQWGEGAEGVSRAMSPGARHATQVLAQARQLHPEGFVILTAKLLEGVFYQCLPICTLDVLLWQTL